MEKEKLKKLSKKLTFEKELSFMDNFRHNLDMYVSNKDITLTEISESSGVPFATLNNMLYKKEKTQDCKLSTAIALSKALGVSIDELVGAGTMSDTERECLSICRNLPDNALYLIQWYIKHQEIVNKSVRKGKRILSVMEPLCNHHGNMKLTDYYKHIDITDLDKENRSKVFFGLKIPCDHYMPLYSPYDILLIANDRNPNPQEYSIVLNDNSIFIAKRKVEDGVAKYYSIRDDRFRLYEEEIDEIIGYVSCVLKGNIKYCD